MKLTIGPEVLKSYRRLSYKVWYAFAEFIDNSTQAFENSKAIMQPTMTESGKLLEVSIIANNKEVIIEDNSIGMSLPEVKKALTIGSIPVISNGRSKYGMGLKTASFWFGNEWKLTTKKLGSNTEISVSISLNKIVEGLLAAEQIDDNSEREVYLESLVPTTERIVDENLHYTVIVIRDLNRKFTQYVQETTKENLRSIFRYDLMNGKLVLRFNGAILSWSKDEFIGRLRRDSRGIPYYKEFEFEIKGKKVKGWAGVLKKGSRKDAGFSLLQNKRVIQGWPRGYKPKSVFGDIEGGVNNLINQRLIGELELEEFLVSHTKDEILFDSEDEEELDLLLDSYLADLKKIAAMPTKDVDPDKNSEIEFEPIITHLLSQLNDTTFRAYVHEYPVLAHAEIEATNAVVVKNAISESSYTNYNAYVGDLMVHVLVNEVASPYDPYLILDYVNLKNEVFIVLNKKHPLWSELTDYYSIARFIKDCIYDGIAEWKAFKTNQRLEPDTIKSIKDLYMRFKMQLD